jgi:hypothetical protein
MECEWVIYTMLNREVSKDQGKNVIPVIINKDKTNVADREPRRPE